ncbi:hypothetical protein JJV70_04300 [Streptomyces sp. JJ66]|uniref:hypothetical protein n=1 Tax=Streptomyces sp. JJ66 TaxID=2803843 RepID=UPI001C59EE04|nr:hypothetical protein [Streptomyces sp. JJ66]MBW1601336.1 hypothetical protein [Streptomyces sp. JJ66]
MPDQDQGEREDFDRDLRALLSTLDALAEDHSPADLVILPRAELERREFRAYASGWQDAEETLRPALEDARATRTRRLRVVPSDSGQADVLTFPLHQQGEHAVTEPLPEADADAPPPPPAAPGAPDGPPGPGPHFDRKRRRSRTPTIPPLHPRVPGQPRKGPEAGA